MIFIFFSERFYNLQKYYTTLFKINPNPDVNCLLLFFFPVKGMIVGFDALICQ